MKFACFTIFVCLNYSTIRPREERLLRNELLTLKLRCLQFIAQIFQAGAVTDCAAALLSFRYPSDILNKDRLVASLAKMLSFKLKTSPCWWPGRGGMVWFSVINKVLLHCAFSVNLAAVVFLCKGVKFHIYYITVHCRFHTYLLS